MASATAALQSLEAHRRVLEKERQEMKDDIAFLRDLRRRYTLPLSELPPCKGLPAPVAASARKFLVDTEAYIMRRISANQKQDVEIGTNAEQLRGNIEQTAQMAHRIAGTMPTAFAAPPGSSFFGGSQANGGFGLQQPNNNNNNNNNSWNPSFGGGGGVTNIQTPGFGGGAGSSSSQINYGAPQMQQGQAPTIGFNDPLFINSPGGASRFNNVGLGGGGAGAGGARSNSFAGTSPAPNFLQGSQFQRPSGGTTEIGFEAPLGVLPYMTAASAAYRQQQALAYLAADQGVLPRGWAPAPLHPSSVGNYGNNANVMSGNNFGNNTSSRIGAGGNVSPSRMRAIEMSGFGGSGEGTTFVVLPRETSKERARMASSTSKRASSAGRK